MRVPPLPSRSEKRRRRAEARLGVAGELGQVGRLQRDLERARASYEREIAVLQPPASTGLTAAPLTRTRCFEDLLELGLSANQARRVVQYLEQRQAEA